MNLSWIKNVRVSRVLSQLIVGLALGCSLASTSALAYSQSEYDVQEITVNALPVEAQATLRQIKQGGPFSYARDGIVFGNYEKRLPKRQRGYYHEYTVKTPGVKSRGARRIICGQVADCYYTADHYETFKQIRE
jgi:ribonuclease T1